MTNFVSVDVEADGPAPGLYSMVSFGAVVIDGEFEKHFYGQVKPISEKYVPEALAVSGHSRAEHESFNDPTEVMNNFLLWTQSLDFSRRPVMVCDNPGFDFGFMNYYLHAYTGENPYGWSCFDLHRFYKGLKQNMYANTRKLKTTKHTHHPVDDARGNAEAFWRIITENNIKGLSPRLKDG